MPIVVSQQGWVKVPKKVSARRDLHQVQSKSSAVRSSTSPSVVIPNPSSLLRSRFRPDEDGSTHDVQVSREDVLSQKSTATGSFEYHVSSRHLMLASPNILMMLSPSWAEGQGLHQDFKSVIKLSGWDDKALLILLRIIHGKTRSVPRKVPLEKLANIAVLVDHYQYLEPVVPMVKRWLETLHGNQPTAYGREVIVWTLVCSVFS